jgi:hypothetical protein
MSAIVVFGVIAISPGMSLFNSPMSKVQPARLARPTAIENTLAKPTRRATKWTASASGAMASLAGDVNTGRIAATMPITRPSSS